MEAVILRDPSYDELMKFIMEDKTDEEEYFDPYYPKCYAYNLLAEIFLRRAAQQGLKGHLILLEREGPHSYWWIVGIETTDRGWFYLWPNIDQEVKLEIGKGYYEANNLYSSDPDPKIVRIIVF